MHGIISSRYSTPEQGAGAPVTATLVSGVVQSRRANDDIEGGGMLAYLAGGGVIDPYVAPPVTSSQVNVERDRRMEAFSFGGKIFGLRMEKGELANVSGAGTLSLAAIVNGAQPGNLRWANPNADFGWIGEDNTLMPMDAQTAWAFASAAAAHRQKVIFAARAIKDMSPIPADFRDNKYWPGG